MKGVRKVRQHKMLGRVAGTRNAVETAIAMARSSKLRTWESMVAATRAAIESWESVTHVGGEGAQEQKAIPSQVR
ncbi:hypothetical protein D6833_02270 [Candidatus Parcubacteria bacterium]|nr:MAG: hypothetical protein D6833_02270 [Candidatus Parcubacteria bacterium]